MPLSTNCCRYSFATYMTCVLSHLDLLEGLCIIYYTCYAPALQAAGPFLSPQDAQQLRAHGSKVSTLAAFAWRQALGLPSGPHAALKEYMIDAATTRLSAHVRDGPVVVSHQHHDSPGFVPIRCTVCQASMSCAHTGERWKAASGPT
jgi:hypothetical protein